MPLNEKDTFKYQTPAWAARLLCLIYFALSVVFYMAYYHYDAWAGHSPSFLRYAFAVVAFVFLLASIRPRNRRAWVYLAANESGLYFPSEQKAIDTSPTLHVPWENVGEIKSDNLYGRKKGFTLELLLSDEEINRYFKRVELTNKILGINNKRNGYYVLAFSQKTFQSVSKVVSALNRLKNRYTKK